MKAAHSYQGGTCVCGKTDPNAGGTDPCQHPNMATIAWKYDDTNHWKICDSCQKEILKGAHSYSEGQCICGKEDPDHEVDHTVIKEIVNDVDATNGVVQIIWDPAKMELVEYNIYADYYSVEEKEGMITIGYIFLSGLTAGKPVAVLTFEAVDPADANVQIVHKEINNDSDPVCRHINTEVRNAKDATCTENGYTGDTWCQNCNTMIEEGETITAPGHDYKDGICTECGQTEPDCEHTNTEIRNAKEATCTENGYTGDTWCKDCNTMINEGRKITAPGHDYKDGVCTECGKAEPGCRHMNVEIRNAKPANCVSGGYTGDTWCKDCNTMIAAGAIIPASGSHTSVPVYGYAATCTTGGMTSGLVCSSCGTWLAYQVSTPALGHAETITTAVAATCTTVGKTEGKHCARCNAVIVAQKEIPALGHTEVVDVAEAATCTTVGKTEGKHCSICSEVLISQQQIPALGHIVVSDAAQAATCTTTGKTEGKHCVTCEEVLVAQEVIPALGHTEVTTYAQAAGCTTTGKTEGKHCAICKEVLVAQEEVPARGHTEIVDAGRNATCTNYGLTDGKHCTVCGQILVAQEIINSTGHVFGQWVVVKEATRTEGGLETRICTCGMTEIHEIAPMGGISPIVMVAIVVIALGAGAAVMFVLMKKRT